MRVLLADDHNIVRSGLRRLLDAEPDIEVVSEASDGREAVELATQQSVDVVVMDLAMPNLNGIEATRQLLAQSPAPKVIVLSMHLDRRFVAGALQAGASGYLLKDCAAEELVSAIRSVAAGRTYLSPQISEVVVEGYVSGLAEDESSAWAVLTPRQREVVQLLAEGKSTNEIASELYVSPKTVETHRHHIMSKLGVDSLAELVKYAIHEGLTSFDA